MKQSSVGPRSNSEVNWDRGTLNLDTLDGCWKGRFQSMASPCELFMEVDDEAEAWKLLQTAADEAWRIERKFSRYSENNIIHQINNSHGHAIEVDDEVAHLLDFAQQCWELSEGMFDITSGVLRRAWCFDGSCNIPDEASVQALLPLVGWQHTRWSRPYFYLPEGMEIDLGGIGKEYAVDRVFLLLKQMTDDRLLLNFGGDINTNGRCRGDGAWSIGIEDPNHTDAATALLKIRQGALATSGDARRYLLRDGKRYGHVLNPHTGWPVDHAPRSVTVAAPSCTEAGVLATFALLQGRNAEAFLQEQGVKYWLYR
ncbi:MAG: FAD:protein FMN transferase [Candidatus Thiodiazotropha endolucinida]